MQSTLVSLGVETFKIALHISLPMLLSGLIAGLIISIFQATTQINETTLSFVPKNFASRRCHHIFDALDGLDDG